MFAVAIGLALLAVARLVGSWVGDNHGNADYRYIWMAGNLWLHGIDPYGPTFAGSRIPDITQSYSLAVWMYPPHWLLIAAPLAIASFPNSFAIWFVCSTLIFIGLSMAAWNAYSTQPATLPWYLVFALTMTPVTWALSTGQPTVFSFAGACLIVLGLRSRASWLIIVGVFLALLKLQVGVPIVILLCARRETRRSAILGMVGAGVASLPSFAIGGTQGGFLNAMLNRDAYSAMPYNTPLQMNGLTHVIARATGLQVSVDLSLLAAVVLGVVIYFVSKKPCMETIVVAGICPMVFIAGLHTYDLIFTVLLLPLVPRMRGWQLATAIAGFLLIWRPENLAKLIGGGGSPVVVADVTTTGSLLICLPFIIWLLTVSTETGANESVSTPRPVG